MNKGILNDSAVFTFAKLYIGYLFSGICSLMAILSEKVAGAKEIR